MSRILFSFLCTYLVKGLNPSSQFYAFGHVGDLLLLPPPQYNSVTSFGCCCVTGAYPQGCQSFGVISPNIVAEESGIKDDSGMQDVQYTEVQNVLQTFKLLKA